MPLQADIIKKIHAFSPTPFALLDDDFKIAWANESAKKRYPALCVPNGLSLLFSSKQMEEVRRAANEKQVFSIPMAAMELFAAVFEPLDDGILLSIGFADQTSAVHILPQSTQFLTAAISGRLRVPLSNVFASVSALSCTEQAQESERINELLQQINLNSYQMLRFAVDFNSYLSLAMGEYEPDVCVTELCDSVGSLMRAASMLTESSGIPLRCTLPDEKVFVMADAAMLNHALLHIISNSCRFTKEGNEISVALSQKENSAVIVVEDKGVGMPQEALSKACEPFYSYDRDGMPMAGSGLGLAIARNIIAHFGGSLAITSREDEGATVAVRLPLCPDTEGLVFKSPPAAADMLRDRFSILHVILSDSCGAPQP